jgi:predicted transcriptional regulator
MIQKLQSKLGMLERHFQILQLVIKEQPIGIFALSDETGFPRHKVRYSLRILEENDLVEPTHDGAVTTEEVSEFLEMPRFASR